MRERKVDRASLEEYIKALGGAPFATVSGVLTTGTDMIREVDLRIPHIGIITTKSYEVEPNRGNREPIIVEDGIGSFGNAVGLRNPGMRKGAADLEKLRSEYHMRALLNVSLSGKSPEEFAKLAKAFSDTADILELNFSCPHAAAGYGMSIGTDPETVAMYVSAVRRVTDLPIFPKLTPNAENIGEIARAALLAGADGISAVNTLGPERFAEPRSGRDVLINSRDNKGGRSGRPIRKIALEKVREIRRAVGEDVPIIGMGGVENGEDVAAMREAGADIVGIGSLWARIHPSQWAPFFQALADDAVHKTKLATDFVLEERRMEYHPHTITASSERAGGVKLVELTGTIDFEASQFVFIWIPGVGEKPFSVVRSNPLTFIIKERGRVSAAICDRKIGETIYIRGVYGNAPPACETDGAIVLAGGTGAAVAPGLVEQLSRENKAIEVFIGVSRRGAETFEKELSKYARCTVVPDDGEAAKVVRRLTEEESGKFARRTLYVIGPADFMKRGLSAFAEFGGKPSRAFASVETPTRCGIGLCGECSCGGRLTCREGTFISAEFLEKNQIDLEDVSAGGAESVYAAPGVLF
ncbi:MAG: tRNA-dihydrouridine synthase [Spirochaetia bacterium]